MLSLLSSPWFALIPLVAFTGIFLGGLVAFSIRCALYGLPRSPRVERLGGSPILGRFLLEFGVWMFHPVERAAVGLRVHPDVLSWTSLALHGVAALLLAVGAFGLGGWMLAFGAACDALDGSVARARGLASDAGEVLDAVVDRWAEMVVFFGYAWYYRNLWWGFALAAAACVGAVLVSYARAKGEIYRIDATMGLMQRHERAVWLVAATVLSALWQVRRAAHGFAYHVPVLVALAAIAILANRAGWQRTAFIRKELRSR